MVSGWIYLKPLLFGVSVLEVLEKIDGTPPDPRTGLSSEGC